MTREEILARVTAILVDSFALEPGLVTPTAHLVDDLDLDSIDAIDMVVRLQEETGLDVEEEELKQIRLVRDVVDLIDRKLVED
jgi:acyl carrier protein